MKSRVWLWSVVAATLSLTSGTARAEGPAAKASGPYVVIVGAGEYLDKAIKPRPTADADAKALYDLLTDTKYLDVKPNRVKLFLSAPDAKRNGEVASHDAVMKAVEAATVATGKDDLLILAFFGRGATAGDKTVFLTPDTTFSDRAKTALVFSNLEPAFKKAKGQKILMLMDVVYKGYDPGMEKVAEPTLTDVDALLFGSEEKEDSVRVQDRLLLLSGFISSDPVANGDRGLFATVLIDALKGAADAPPNSEGYEPDGVVTVDELIKYLEKEVPNLARKLGKTDKEKEAQAVPIGSRTSHFVITKNPAETAKVQKRLDSLAALAKNEGVTPELAKEGAALLARMPKLKAHQELRKNYQKLADGGMKLEEFTAARDKIREDMKLNAKDAVSFASKVNDAMSIVTGVYIKKVEANDLAVAAIKGMYRRIEEPIPAELEGMLQDAKDGGSETKRTELLRDARMRLGKREDLDDNKDADVAILMMMASLNDPYSVYYDKDTVRKMASALRGRFPGVGIQIRRDAVHDALLVVSPIKGSPAFHGGIQAGDLITGVIRSVDNVTGKPLPESAQKEFTTKSMKTDDAIAIITGLPGTPITLVVEREGKEIKFDLKRNWVSVETVLGVKRDTHADWDFTIDAKNKIGYIRLTQFTQTSAGDLRSAIDGLKKNGGLNGLILDLRGNPGGYLTSATKICEMFVGKEKLVTVKPRTGSDAGRPRSHRGEANGDKSFDLVVLINGHSASASEIVAACVQDHERATVIGERSYGKGSVQDVVTFSETEGEIKLTIARYYPPSDRNIDKLASEQDKTITDWGVHPDKGFEVKLTREEQNELDTLMRDLEIIPTATGKKLVVDEEKDKQLKAALAILRAKATEKNKGASK